MDWGWRKDILELTGWKLEDSWGRRPKGCSHLQKIFVNVGIKWFGSGESQSWAGHSICVILLRIVVREKW